MATLVLTALGTAVGGPIGGAIGGLLGNLADRQWLGKTREGPRLTELAVQTSSYGTPIPQLFGTIRVAGTVIWAADLKETRERSGGGKGQPAVGGYSYAASFAVLLSARAITGIGRVWADGRLIRGGAGDLKVKAMLRVHTGAEDQAVDPLIASAEVATPAYRGCAYLVWEDLPLAEFGNRIPSLTVEVIADAVSPNVGAIVRAVAPMASGGAGTVDGFAATGSVRGVLAVVGELADGWWSDLRLAQDGDAVSVIVDAGIVASGMKGAARSRSIAAIEGVPRSVTVGHYDRARDYQAGVQRVSRPGAGHRDERIEMPAVMTADVARTLAGRMLARRDADRTRRTVTLGFEGLTRRAGEIVTIRGEQGRWRVLEVSVEAMAVRLTLTPMAAVTLPMAGATSGRVARMADDPIGATLLRLIETPAFDGTLLTAPRLTVVAAGEGAGWRRAALLWSMDDGAQWIEAGSTGAPGIVGTIEAVPSAAAGDETGAVIVRLARGDMMLADADDASLGMGVNLAMAGAELMQFGRAAPLGGGRWRLTRLWRGRRETEATPLTAGDGFAILTGDTRFIDLPLSALGREVRVMAVGVDDDPPAEARIVIAGASIRPPSPVDLRWEATDGGVLRWTRRSRAGSNWPNGVPVPLGEETERYRITVTDTNGVRDVESVVPMLALPGVAGTRVAVRQRGIWAESLPATIVL